MNITRKQHYVYRAYLRSWTNETNAIYCSFNGQPSIKANLMNVGNQRDFYKLKPINELEKQFLTNLIGDYLPKEIQDELKNWIELYCYTNKLQKFKDYFLKGNKQADTVLKKYLTETEEHIQNDIENSGLIYINYIKSGELYKCLTDEEIITFYIFICMQYLRTKKILKLLIDTQTSKHQVNFDFANVIAPSRHILSHNIACMLVLKKYKVVLLKNNTIQEFITGDQPCVNTFANYAKNGGTAKDFEMYYPISPTLALLITKKEQFENCQEIELNLNDVHIYNRQIISASLMQVYCSDPSGLDFYLTQNN